MLSESRLSVVDTRTRSFIVKSDAVMPVRLFFTTFAICILIVGCPASLNAQTDCPNPPSPSISSAQVPSDVCIPATFAGNPIAFFDDYFWKSFIALVWPAAPGKRGIPDLSKTVSGPGPKVFETYKTLGEVFHIDGSTPAAWDGFDAPGMNPCSVSTEFGDVVLASFSKFSDLGQAGFGTLIGPLVAQNTTYVRYLSSFNETEFNQIVAGKWYLRSNLPATITFSNSALDVKSAWVDMKNMPHPERYYKRMAWVLDPQTGNCAQTTVGLVGLHIVQKTPSRPQWIWSTFEQMDNVPTAQSSAAGEFGFNDGKGTPMPPGNPYPISPLIVPTPPPVNIQRIKPIHASTQQTNVTYASLLRAENSAWQFYQLVMTQWPLPVSSPQTPGTPSNTFPGLGTDQTAFANTTLETFEQSNIRTGCMNCHNQTMAATDFLWGLNDHAFPPTLPGLLFKNPAFRELEQLMQLASPANVSKSMKREETTPKK
jgi:hypothetical protein